METTIGTSVPRIVIIRHPDSEAYREPRTSMIAMYILQSEKDGTFYVGSTEDLDQRIIKHNKGYSRYTKSKRPWKLVYNEAYETLSEAKKREYFIKSLKSKKAIEKLINGPIV